MFECRLTPDPALLTLDEAEEFLRGSPVSDSTLPSSPRSAGDARPVGQSALAGNDP